VSDPTVAQRLGVPSFESIGMGSAAVTTWWGVFGAPTVPQAQHARATSAILAAGNDPAMQQVAQELKLAMSLGEGSALERLLSSGRNYVAGTEPAEYKEMTARAQQVVGNVGQAAASASYGAAGTASGQGSAVQSAARSSTARSTVMTPESRGEAYRRCGDKAYKASSAVTSRAIVLPRGSTSRQLDIAMWQRSLEASTRELAVYENDPDCLAVRDHEPYIVTKTNTARAHIEQYRKWISGAGNVPWTDPSAGRTSGRASGQDCRANNPNIPVGTCQ